MDATNFIHSGLSSNEVAQSRKKNGSNVVIIKKKNQLLAAILNFFSDPMMLLLIATAALYFFNNNISDAVFLLFAIILISAITSFQSARSKNALLQLKSFIKPKCQVIRNSKSEAIKTEDLVLGDCIVVNEGDTIPADAIILQANDFLVNQAMLTGESVPLAITETTTETTIFKGTTVVSGQAFAKVTAIGNQTKLGTLSKSIIDIAEEKTPLELQINRFVKKMAFIGICIFLIVWGINYFKTYNLYDSLLKALTLAMSILPEEIPLAFTAFMALGAWRMMQNGIVVKQMKTLETLGSATVICIDKTGTITENNMELAKIVSAKSNQITAAENNLSNDEKDLIEMAMWASETSPFDPMEIAIHQKYKESTLKDARPFYKMVHEYPLAGKPPMMTHIFKNNTKDVIIAAKGGAEAIVAISKLSATNKKQITEKISLLAKDGYRVLAVGSATFDGENYPKNQQDFLFNFMGLLAFYDPPKKNISKVIQHFYKAGIAVKIITGDSTETTQAIAKQINFFGSDRSITGDALMQLSEEELKKAVNSFTIFTRMFPEAKLKIINALKETKHIVAMTGDGVNDGPALKAAHIGIAMGKNGSEIAKQTASLILVKDNLFKMVYAIGMGRKIYSNLKKGIQFIITIHIPIILIVFVPLVLNWQFPSIFSPLHIIFLELIMGPTCSIVYENEPMEKNTMLQKPRAFTSTFFNNKELLISIVQGLVIAAASLFCYQYANYYNFSENTTRTFLFVQLITANCTLTLVNRSFYYSVITTLFYKNNLVPFIIFLTICITTSIILLPSLRQFFSFSLLTTSQLIFTILIGFTSVIWVELLKFWKRTQGLARLV